MGNYMTLLWETLTSSQAIAQKELQQLGVLQQTSNKRHAEYAAMSLEPSKRDDTSHNNELSLSRKLMEEADSAHMVALQKWENRQSRQKSY